MTNNERIAIFMGGLVVSGDEGSKTFRYDYSWDALMPVIDKINGLGKQFQFALFKTYVSCTVEKSGKFYKDFSFSHAEYITTEQNKITAAYKLVIKFLDWYEINKSSIA